MVRIIMTEARVDAAKRARVWTAGFCAVVLVATLAYLVLGIQQEERDTRALIATSAQFAAGWLRSTFDASDQALRDVAGDVTGADIRNPQADALRHGRVLEALESRRRTVPFATGIGLADSMCNVTHATGVVGFDAALREWCLAVRAGATVDIAVSRLVTLTSGERLVVQMRRLPGSGFIGVAALGLSLEAFTQRTPQVASLSDGETLVIDNARNLLGRTPAMPELMGKPVVLAGVESFLAEGEPIRHFTERSPVDGASRLWVARHVDGLPFAVLVGVARSHWLTARATRIGMAATLVMVIWTLAWLALRFRLEVIEAQARLLQINAADALTGAATRRHFLAEASKEVSRARRYRGELALLRLDVDQLGRIAERAGLEIVEQIVGAVAQACRASLRPFDLFGRLGDDQFAVLLPNTPASGAREVAERIRKAVLNLEVRDVEGQRVPVSVSMGGIALGETGEPIASLMPRVEVALQQAKRAGRGRFEFVDESIFSTS